MRQRTLRVSTLLLILIFLSGYPQHSMVAANPAIGSIKTTLYPTADAFVDSSNPSTNYGGAQTINVSANAIQGFAYLKFDLSSVPPQAQILSAKMMIYLTATSGAIYGLPADTIGTHYCSNTSWTEYQIAWSNKPSFDSTPTATWSFSLLTSKDYKTWDVNVDVQRAIPAGALSEVLEFKHKTGDGVAVFQSKEGANSPKLAIEYSLEPVFTVHLSSVQDTGQTADLGLVTFENSTFGLPTDIQVVNGSYIISYNGGYTFIRWETTGGVTVSDENSKSTLVAVLGNGTLKAVGNAGNVEYLYDHESPTWHSEQSGHANAVVFTPMFSGLLVRARCYVYDLSPYESNTWRIHVLDENLGDLVTPFNATPVSKGWFDVDLSAYNLQVTLNKNFSISVEWLTDYNPDIGSDYTSPSHRSWYWNGTVWQAQLYCDYMIRAVVSVAGPQIFVLSPENKTYATGSIPLTFTVDRSTSWIGYDLDMNVNVTITGNTTLTGLLDGSHSVMVYANDTSGEMRASNTVSFCTDTTPPHMINVAQNPSAENVTAMEQVAVSVTINDVTSGVKQAVLNFTNGNGTWISIQMAKTIGDLWNATIPAQPYGTYVNYTILAEDNAGNAINTQDFFGYQYQYHVIPESLFSLFSSLFIMATLLTAIAYRKKRNLAL